MRDFEQQKFLISTLCFTLKKKTVSNLNIFQLKLGFKSVFVCYLFDSILYTRRIFFSN